MEDGRGHVILHASRLAERAAPRVGPEQILHPRSVAVFGASDSKDKFGGRITHFLIRHGFPGALYPINPRRGEVRGRPAYPSINRCPALDVEAVVDTVVRVSWLASDLGARLVDLEINPLIVGRAGHGAVAVDARGSVADAGIQHS